MQIHPIKELEKRIGLNGDQFYPRFIRMLRDVAETSIHVREGVLLLGHTPEIAPEAYCHVLYPPVCDELPPEKLYVLSSLPEEFSALFKIMNGATLFSGGVELWGFQVDANRFTLPAYYLTCALSSFDPATKMAFASTNCGDIAYFQFQQKTVRIEYADPGLATQEFESIDDWLVFCSEGS